MLFRGPMGGGAASGKIGAMIASHCAQGQYLKSRVKSTNPRSELQHVPRNALARLAAFWTEQLTAPQQAAWATYAANVTWLNRLGDTVHLSGQMEFIRSNAPRLQADVLYGDPFDFPLLGIVADAPTVFDRGDPGPTPTINSVPGNDYLTLVYDNTADWVTSDTSNSMLVYVAIPKNSSVSFFRRRTRLAGIVHASDATGAFNFLNQWLPAIAYRQKWTAWWCISRADGRLTRAVPVAPFDTGPGPPPPWVETFTYANGSINGKDSWTSPHSLAGPLVISSNALIGTASTFSDAICTDPLILNHWLGPWSFSCSLTVSLGDDLETGILIYFGDSASNFWRIGVTFVPGDRSTNQVTAVDCSSSASANTFGPAAWTIGIPHTLSATFDGTTLSVLIDGLVIGTTTFAPTSTPTAAVTVFIDNDAFPLTLTADNFQLQQS